MIRGTLVNHPAEFFAYMDAFSCRKSLQTKDLQQIFQKSYTIPKTIGQIRTTSSPSSPVPAPCSPAQHPLALPKCCHSSSVRRQHARAPVRKDQTRVRVHQTTRTYTDTGQYAHVILLSIRKQRELRSHVKFCHTLMKNCDQTWQLYENKRLDRGRNRVNL
jgi:hypothetical protein